MDIESVEREIAATYVFFAENAPGIRVQETGHLADLWAVADAYYALEESE